MIHTFYSNENLRDVSNSLLGCILNCNEYNFYLYADDIAVRVPTENTLPQMLNILLTSRHQT